MSQTSSLRMASLPMVVLAAYVWCMLMASQSSTLSVHAWTNDILPKLKLKFEQEKRLIYFGNQSDYFRILDQDDTSILIGAR